MADDEAAVAATELSDQPVVNGFGRLTTTANASTNTAQGAEGGAARVDEPKARPEGHAPERPPDPTNHPQWPTLPRADQVARAQRVLQESLVAHAFGQLPDPGRLAREEIARGHGQVMVTALYALAGEGLGRVMDRDPEGQALQALGVSQVSFHLFHMADRMAEAGGFTVPEWVRWQPSIEGTEDARARAEAAALFDSFSPEQMRVVLAGPPSLPPPGLSAEAVPTLAPHDLQSPARLRQQLHGRMEHWREHPGGAPVGVPTALAIIDDAMMTVGFDYPARIPAIRAVSIDATPLHTAVRLRQFADLLDGHFGDPAAQLDRFGAYEASRTLADHLRGIATEITRIAKDPAFTARVRVETLFGTLNAEAQAAADQAAAAQTTANQPRPSVSSDTAAVGTGQRTPAANDSQPDSDASAEPTPYRYNPNLLPEHAVVGSLVHSPSTLHDLDDFLGVRDFSDSDVAAVYQTLRGLHANKSLFDVASMPSLDRQYQAANENQLKAFAALCTGQFISKPMSTSDAQRILGQIATAAPAESVPFRGVYDPVAQLELARMVKEDSIRRQATSMGIRTRRTTPMIPPSQPVSGPAEREIQALVTNLELMDGQVEHLAQQVAAAVKRTGPDIVDTIPGLAEATIAQAHNKRWRMPDRFKALTEPLLHRAERHILHLALHSGRMDLLPESIRNLSPDAFSDSRHANTWRAIKDVQARGQAVNYVSVRMAIQAPHFAHHPVLGERVLLAMAQPPDWTPEQVRPERIARSLRMVVSAGLSRARDNVQEKVAAVASAGPAIPAAAALNHTRQEIGGLTEHARTALDLHRELAARQDSPTRHNATR